jgi:secondary thiamine-phosphate synthase enzyme
MGTVHAQEEVAIRTAGRGLVSIQNEVAAIVRKAGVAVGQAHLFLLHTSAGLLVTENADPDVHRDLESWLRTQAPDGGGGRYLHDAEGPDDMPSHIRTLLTCTSLTLPVREGKLVLGTWQGVYLYEHRTAPHDRRVVVTVAGSARDRGDR